MGEGVDVEQLASEFAPEVSPPPAVLRRRQTDPLVEPMLRSLEDGGVVEMVVEGPCRLATCWRFVIPKTSKEVLAIFHLVDFNDTMPCRGHFSLCSWEDMADRLSAWPQHAPLYCTHIDFWSFVLPATAAGAFRLGFRPGGASIGQVWTRHLAPAAPASRPSSPSQFHDCPCHADSALQFVPSLVLGWGKSRAASTGFRALSPSD